MTPHLYSSMYAEKAHLMTPAITQTHMLHLSYPPPHIKEKKCIYTDFFPSSRPSLHLVNWLFIVKNLSYLVWKKDLNLASRSLHYHVSHNVLVSSNYIYNLTSCHAKVTLINFIHSHRDKEDNGTGSRIIRQLMT